MQRNHPTAEWTAIQVQQALFDDDFETRFLLRDRDGIYGEAFRAKVKALDLEEVRTAHRSPWKNPFAERMIGTIRRELLDHVIVLGETHLRRLVSGYPGTHHAINSGGSGAKPPMRVGLTTSPWESEKRVSGVLYFRAANDHLLAVHARGRRFRCNR